MAVVCAQGRHSDKVSNDMYTARLRCAQFRKCVMEITTKRGKIEKQGVCLCEIRIDGSSQRNGNASACSELQSDWGRAVGQRGVSERGGPESLGRRNSSDAKIRPGEALLYRDAHKAVEACSCMGIRLGNGTSPWLGSCSSHSGGGCILAIHPCPLEQGVQ